MPVGHQDWKNGTVAGSALAPANYTSTQTGPAFDTAPTEGQLALVVSGTVNTGTVAVKVTESDTAGGSYTDVAICDTETLTTAFAASARVLNFYPTKRYVKAVFTGASTPDFNLAGAYIGRRKANT